MLVHGEIKTAEQTRMKMSRFSSFDASGYSDNSLKQAISDVINLIPSLEKSKRDNINCKKTKYTEYLHNRAGALRCQARRDQFTLNRKKENACTKSNLNNWYILWESRKEDYVRCSNEIPKATKKLNDAIEKRDSLVKELDKRNKEKQTELLNKDLNNNTQAWSDKANEEYKVEPPPPPPPPKPSYTKYYIIGGGALVIGVVGLILFRR